MKLWFKALLMQARKTMSPEGESWTTLEQPLSFNHHSTAQCTQVCAYKMRIPLSLSLSQSGSLCTPCAEFLILCGLFVNQTSKRWQSLAAAAMLGFEKQQLSWPCTGASK